MPTVFGLPEHSYWCIKRQQKKFLECGKMEDFTQYTGFSSMSARVGIKMYQ